MVAKATQTTSDSSVIDTSGGDKPSDEPSDKSGEKRRGKRGSKRGSKRGEGKGPHGRTGTSAGSGSNGEPAVFSDAQRSSLSQHRSANESDTRPASDEASAGTAHSGNAHVDRNVPAEGSDVKNEEVPTPTTRHFDAEVEVGKSRGELLDFMLDMVVQMLRRSTLQNHPERCLSRGL